MFETEDEIRGQVTTAAVRSINEVCGPLGAPESHRVLDISTRGIYDSDPAEAAALSQDLIGLGAVSVASTLGSPGTLGAVPTALANNVPLAVAFASDVRLSGCTQAELANPAIVKSSTPVYGPGQCFDHRGFIFRAGPTTSTWSMAAAERLHRAHPWLTRAALFWPDNGTGVGAAARDAFQSRFEGYGGTLVADRSFTPNASADEAKALLKGAAPSGPEVFCVSALGVRQFLQAYLELRDDPTWTDKPAGFDSVRLLFPTSSQGDNWDWLVGTGKLDVVVNQVEGIESAIDVSSLQWLRLEQLLASMFPEQFDIYHAELAARYYDELMVLVLALAKAGVAEGPAIAAEIRNVANPPGELVYPGEFAKAKALLAAGQDIDYVGAGFADIDERGDATGITWGVWVVSPDGTIQRNVDLFQVQP